MKEKVLEPIIASGDVIVQFSEPQIVDKTLYISVPSNFKAIGFIDERAMFRLDPCSKTPIIKLIGKDFIGKELKVAFILAKNLASMSYGFGNIEVNNDRLKEAYRVGANGKYIVEVSDYTKLINAFSMNENIDIDMIRDKSVSAIRTVGIPLLAKYFANTNTSVFEISSLIQDLRDNLLEALKDEDIIKRLGIRVSSITVDGIHVNEDDMEVIRNRLNKETE